MGKRWINKIFLVCVVPMIMAASCGEQPVVEFDDIEGFYSCNESSAHSGYRKYIVEIDKVLSQENTYIIANFHNSGDNEFLYAEYADDTLYIRNQVIGTLFVNGKGYVYPEFNRIELEYKTDDGLTILDYYSLYER